MLILLFNFSKLGGCPQNWFVRGEHLYYISSEGVDYNSAVAACEALEANLTSIHNEDELLFHRSKYTDIFFISFHLPDIKHHIAQYNFMLH